MVSTFRNRIKLAVTILVLFLGAPGTQHSILHDALAETQNNAAKIAAKDLESAIADRASRVDEFRFIREKAEKLGVRAWLFGGTAAGFGHYVNWDLKREGGDKRFQPDRFDYDYTNIYRSTQDLDIVIDGTPEQVEALEEALRQKYPHLQGSKSAWEVRLLKAPLGEKEALLDNPDYLNQHTDSNSTGMIELTKPKAGENVVRDLRDWNSKDPNFLKDLRDGKLHYYFSPKHGETSRAAQGLNPPILSAIRYLTKAFQYELEMRPEDLAKIKKVIDTFDPKRNVQVQDSYVSSWIEKNGKKLIQHAVNIEYAWDTLESLGLRKKLIAIKKNASQEDSLAWWLSKEPLRTKPLGREKGKTAKALGLDIVAHETRNFLAYESITRAHTGDANVLISRKQGAGETALYGDGFYTRAGKKGAAGTGLTIRFHLDPDAREGPDFKRHGSDYVVIKNKAALKVIPESLSFTPLEYLRLLGRGKKISQDDRGILEKLRRRSATKISALSPEEERKIFQYASKSSSRSVIDQWISWGLARKHPEQVARIVEKVLQAKKSSQETTGLYWILTDVLPKYRDPVLLEKVAKEIQRFSEPSSHYTRALANVFSSPLWAGDHELMLKLIKKRNLVPPHHWIAGPLSKGWGTRPEMVEEFLSLADKERNIEIRGGIHHSVVRLLGEPHWAKQSQFYAPILKQGLVDPILASFLAKRFPDEIPPDWIDTLIKRGSADLELIENVPPEYWTKHPEKLKAIVKNGRADAQIVSYLLVRPEFKDSELLRQLIKRRRADSEIVRKVFRQPFWSDQIHLLVEMIEKGSWANERDWMDLLRDPAMTSHGHLLKKVYEKAKGHLSTRTNILNVLSSDHWAGNRALLHELLSLPDAEYEIVRYVLTSPKFKDRGDIIDRLVKEATASPGRPNNRASHLLGMVLFKDHWVENPKWVSWVQRLIDERVVNAADLERFLYNPAALKRPEWFGAWLTMLHEEKDRYADMRVSGMLRGSHWKESDGLRKLAGVETLTAGNLLKAWLRGTTSKCQKGFAELK